MTSNNFLPVLICSIVCMVVLPGGLALRCYFCSSPESCINPVKKTCVQFGGFPAPDRCWMHRETAFVDGARVVLKDTRSCMHAYQCLDTFHCNKSHINVECEAGCCKDDLCNHHAFEPSSPTYSKPNGADLSCYSCSDLPKEVLSNNLPVKFVKCAKPAKQQCGVSTLHKDLIQDRCITLNVEVKLPNSEVKKMQYRSCADLSFCSNSNEAWSHVLRQQMGPTAKTTASCCTGNLCGSDGRMIGSKPGLTILAGLAALLLTCWMN